MRVSHGLLAVFISTGLFCLLNKCLTLIGIPKTAQKSTWRWKNICTSFVHSILTGVGSVLCFWETPEMAEDLISIHTPFSRGLICFSVGYFLYDTLDMFLFNRGRQTYELIGHHCVILCCFGITIVTHLYVGYAVVALIVELNSIFLHLRQLFQILEISRGSALYRLNSLINLATYICFRIVTLCWMTRWLVINRDGIPLLFYSFGSVGMAIVILMNIVLFYRLIHSDFLRKRDSATKVE
ncbi:TLC domain-containing protein 2-like [Liolophura sinensis]|uniref:TLC domain-containing protein 2-like n=1 Tax=Liolophura sinensis TaxID=3198878 RepID=UPI00315862B0